MARTDGDPWGNEEPDASRGCFDLDPLESQPDSVGSHPARRGSFGHLDLAGNVWEWCDDEVELIGDHWLDDKKAGGRALRGGGWGSPALNLGAASRFGFSAGGRGSSIGFRVAVAPRD